MKLKTPYQTVIEAANEWQQPIAHVIQAAGNDQFPLFVMADHWELEKNGANRSIDGWVELDPKEVLKAITQDYVKVTRVSQNSQWKTLKEPQSIRFGAVFVEKVLDEKSTEPTQAKKKAIETDEALLTVDQAAEYLKLKRNTLDKHRTNGKGPIYQHAGRSVRYRKSDLDNWDR